MNPWFLPTVITTVKQQDTNLTSAASAASDELDWGCGNPDDHGTRSLLWWIRPEPLAKQTCGRICVFFFLWNTSWDEWNFMVKDDGEKVTVALSWKASPGDFHCQWKLDRIRSATILWITLVEKKMGEEYWRIVRMMGHDDNVLNSHGSNPYTWGQSYGEAQFAMERGWKRLLYFHVSFAEATLRKPGLNNDCFSQTGYFGFFFQGSVICGVLELRSTWHLFVSWRQPKIPTGGGCSAGVSRCFRCHSKVWNLGTRERYTWLKMRCKTVGSSDYRISESVWNIVTCYNHCCLVVAWEILGT